MLSNLKLIKLIGMDIRFMLSQIFLLLEPFVTFFAFKRSFLSAGLSIIGFDPVSAILFILVTIKNVSMFIYLKYDNYTKLILISILVR